MRFPFIIIFVLTLIFSCSSKEVEYSERTFISPSTKDSFVIRSYPHLELDSIWRYQRDEEIVTIYSGDSLLGCFGSVKLYFYSGELHGIGECIDGFPEGVWKFYRKSGDMLHKDFVEKGKTYQKWVPRNEETIKLVAPIIEIKPETLYILDTFTIRAKYNFEGIDTKNWDYYLIFDFMRKEKFLNADYLPYENHIKKYEGEAIIYRSRFYEPADAVLYGYTLGINRLTGDSIFHLEIENQFFTILDSTSIEF